MSPITKSGNTGTFGSTNNTQKNPWSKETSHSGPAEKKGSNVTSCYKATVDKGTGSRGK